MKPQKCWPQVGPIKLMAHSFLAAHERPQKWDRPEKSISNCALPLGHLGLVPRASCLSFCSFPPESDPYIIDYVLSICLRLGRTCKESEQTKTKH